jgi:hypothetical protein
MRKTTPGRTVSPLVGLKRNSGEPAHAFTRPTFRVRNGLQYVEFSGWVASIREGGKTARAWLVIDGRLYPALVRRFRLGASGDGSSGSHYRQFQHEVPLTELWPGRHRIALAVLTRDGTSYVQGADKEFSLVAEGLTLVTTDVR